MADVHAVLLAIVLCSGQPYPTATFCFYSGIYVITRFYGGVVGAAAVIVGNKEKEAQKEAT